MPNYNYSGQYGNPSSYYDDHSFKCPYCFADMTHRTVLFRANTGFTQEELSEEQMADDSSFTMVSSNQDRQRSSDLEIKWLFRRYDDENSLNSDKKLDKELIEFWEKRGGESGYVDADPNWDYPHIDPTDPETFRQMISTESRGGFQPDPDGFVRDKDGFITRVLDRYSGAASQMTRLCPKCHNPLPLPDYGKYPILFISVVGITGAGKTVYLNQLLNRFATVIQNTGYRMGPSALAVNEVVMENHPLPSSTDDQTMRRPLAVSLTKKNDSTDGLTIVFYDIAGENCIKFMESSDRQKKDSTAIGKFIAYSDALLFLIDPEQVPIFAAPDTYDTTVKLKHVQDVIDVVNRIRVQLNTQHPNWDGIPVAAVLTKSDILLDRASKNAILRSQLPPDHPIFQHLSNTETQGFNRDDFYGIHRQLCHEFAEHAPDITASMASFAQKGYFAVSAITCGVENRFEKYQNLYSFTNENYKKFTELVSWSKDWNSRSPEEREHFGKCPVLDKDGAPISFPIDTSITAETASGIVTEIFAESHQGGYVDRIYLGLWEVASQSINPIGYPTAPPNPRRIAEPIRWILWKKRYLEPYFIPEPQPQKSFFMGKKKYENLVTMWAIQNETNAKHFYFEEEEENG